MQPSLLIKATVGDREGLSTWDNEGGCVVANAGVVADTSPAVLPARFSAQSAWAFPDRSGRCSYQFYRVYGEPVRGPRGALQPLERERCYWERTALENASETRRVLYLSLLGPRALLPGLSFDAFAGLRVDALF